MAISKQDALDYHTMGGRPGKIEVVATKPMATQRELSLAYSPGVADPCLEIEKNPDDAYLYTAKGNLVAVISNGTAVLGLGDIGALASKPVMEGKGVLFKRFAGIDVFDIELASKDPEEIIRTCQLLEPTFGGINLEDIKAPECFHIEETLKETMDIPVFHDDQHGTAIIGAAGLLNALDIVGKKIDEVRVVFSGAGASALSSARHFMRLGVRHENMMMVDSKGVIFKGRTEGMNEFKEEWAVETEARTLDDAMNGADVFVGLSVAGMVSKDMVRSMAKDPIIFGLANPVPEILPEEVAEVRDDAIMATGRSDYPNQVNNVLGFPFIFRGALDVRARSITPNMMLAATHALADLARQEVPESVMMAYGDEQHRVRPGLHHPQTLRSKGLVLRLSGRRQGRHGGRCIQDRTGSGRIPGSPEGQPRAGHGSHAENDVHGPAGPEAGGSSRRVSTTESSGPPRRWWRRAWRSPSSSANPTGSGQKAEELGVDLKGVEIIYPADEDDKREQYAQALYDRRLRKGTHPGRSPGPDVQSAPFRRHDGSGGGCRRHGGRHRVQLPGDHSACFAGGGEGRWRRPCGGPLHDRPAEQEATLLRRHFREYRAGCGHAGGDRHPLRRVRQGTEDRAPGRHALLLQLRFGTPPLLEEDGRGRRSGLRSWIRIWRWTVRCRPIAALNNHMLREHFPFSDLSGPANILVFPNLGAANTAYKLMGEIGGAEVIGPILLGMRRPVHVLQRGSTVQDVVNLITIASVDAAEQGRARGSRLTVTQDQGIEP